MRLTKETLKQIIKEELDTVMEEGAGTMAYLSSQDRVELQYGGKRVDFMYSYAGQYATQVKNAIQSLANQEGRTIGSIPNLAEAIIYYLEQGGMEADVPSLQQLKDMPVYSG